MDKKIFCMLLLIAAIGFAAGSFFEISVVGQAKTQLESLLPDLFSSEGSGISLLSSTLQNLCSGLPLLLLSFFLPSFPFLLFPLALFLAMQNLLYGISAVILLEAFGTWHGILHILIGIIPAILPRTLLFSALGSYGFACFAEMSSSRRKPMGIKKTLRLLARSSAAPFISAFIVLLVISFIQAILQQAML